jgi:hypothetical protein
MMMYEAKYIQPRLIHAHAPIVGLELDKIAHQDLCVSTADDQFKVYDGARDFDICTEMEWSDLGEGCPMVLFPTYSACAFARNSATVEVISTLPDTPEGSVIIATFVPPESAQIVALAVSSCEQYVYVALESGVVYVVHVFETHCGRSMCHLVETLHPPALRHSPWNRVTAMTAFNDAVFVGYISGDVQTWRLHEVLPISSSATPTPTPTPRLARIHTSIRTVARVRAITAYTDDTTGDVKLLVCSDIRIINARSKIITLTHNDALLAHHKERHDAVQLSPRSYKCNHIITAIVVNTTRRECYTTGWHSGIQIHNLDTLDVLYTLPLPTLRYGDVHLAISSDNKMLFSAIHRHTDIQLWHV